MDTLKDTDFQNLEKKLKIEGKIRQELINQIYMDSSYLQSIKIIDYSLLIVKVDHYNLKEYLKEFHRYDELLVIELIDHK